MSGIHLRRRCPICGTDVPILKNGSLGKHNIADPKKPHHRLFETSTCKGSGVVFGEVRQATVAGTEEASS